MVRDAFDEDGTFLHIDPDGTASIDGDVVDDRIRKDESDVSFLVARSPAESCNIDFILGSNINEYRVIRLDFLGGVDEILFDIAEFFVAALFHTSFGYRKDLSQTLQLVLADFPACRRAFPFTFDARFCWMYCSHKLRSIFWRLAPSSAGH